MDKSLTGLEILVDQAVEVFAGNFDVMAGRAAVQIAKGAVEINSDRRWITDRPKPVF